MTTTINEVLDQLRATALDQRDKGDKFERLIQGYLRTDPEWALQFGDVWLWSEWPGRDDKPDTGIDLVARARDSNELTAIQCKFYAPEHHVQKADIDSFFTASGKEGFSRRIVVSTSGWSKNAEDALVGQQVGTQRLDVAYLNESTVDWSQYSLTTPSVMPTRGPKTLRPHQSEALDAVRRGLAVHDRGKLVMACGTGKTFTSLRIAEELVGAGGTVLFLVPSISLLSQSLREWSQEASVPLRPFAVCSDVRVGRRQTEDMGVVDLAEPATTSAAKLLERMGRSPAAGRMTVVFSTYQSIQAVADAQQAGGLPELDLVVCDEAHRTTGVTLAGQDESAFVRVHDQDCLAARKRLYMTATPRLYDDASKSKATEKTAVVASMDDESIYGPELHRLGFGEAVERDLLSDYKVLVLAVDEKSVSTQFQSQLADENNELRLDDAAKLVGCWNGLAKRGLDRGRLHTNAAPMRRAVAFAENIKVSQKVARLFEVVGDQLVATAGQDAERLRIEAEHVDGTFNVLRRNALLDWLKADPAPGEGDRDSVCRVLSNARCLSEGVDVPALDAVLFLNPRNSVVDVVQSVGRVMRKAPGKEYGYVILPIGIPTDLPPEQALADNQKYKVVWQVLQALRAHDERFDAMVNKIDLNRGSDDTLQVIGVPGDGGRDREQGDGTAQGQLALGWSEEWRDAIYAKIVAKVGQRSYWEDWARDIAVIADRHVTRIRALLDDPSLDVSGFFDRFHTGLRANLNDSISRDNAVEMLAQHIITKPVFDALFEGYEFTEHNPVSLVMQDMLDVLDEQGIDKETATLDTFYASVAARAKDITNAEGKQRVITELYEKFFKNAFPKAASSLGIVYTPVEIVDFILRSVQNLLATEFGASLDDEGVHVLDPFTGTGTFIVRLLQSGLVSAESLLRKYTSELHANEINLLAYYVAAVNIEATFHGIASGWSSAVETPYRPFEGIVLTDTFQMHEANDALDSLIFPQNNQRVLDQLATDITVIVGNPPYSAGQTSANDDNANLKYPTLDSRIEQTYAARSSATNKNSLYDSYIRAIRWASDRVGDAGIVAYVSNGGYIDSNTADGLRQCLAEDFDAIYVYNLRGNQRTAGEQSRREGGKVFGSGSRTTVAILFLVRRPTDPANVFTLGDTEIVLSPAARLHYRDIGDSLTREQKLEIVGVGDVSSVQWQELVPNRHGDWVNQRRDDFERFPPIGGKDRDSIFALHSSGVKTNRDAWVYNFSGERLRIRTRAMVDFYNAEVDRLTDGGEPNYDATRFSWNRADGVNVQRGRRYVVSEGMFRVGRYRPFTKEHVCFARSLNDMVYRQEQVFPTRELENRGFYLVGAGSDRPFASLMTDAIPDLALWGSSSGQFFPRWTYQKLEDEGAFDFGDEPGVGHRRVDNITNAALADYRSTYGEAVTKDDIFYYVYGLLHSPTYRAEYAADLKKVLPRVPKVRDFHGFVAAGRTLAELHLGYESVEPWDLTEEVSTGSTTGGSPPAGEAAYDFYRVQKMAFGKGPRKDGRVTRDRTRIVYSPRITVSGIPEEAYRYLLGSRSAVEWIMDRYQVRTDEPSGIVNDPNDWSREHQQPRYVLDLLKRIVAVSVETMRIVDALPELNIIEAADPA